MVVMGRYVNPGDSVAKGSSRHAYPILLKWIQMYIDEIDMPKVEEGQLVDIDGAPRPAKGRRDCFQCRG